MRLKVLGAYGASDSEHNLTGYLLEERFAVDAGTLTSKLTLAQQSRIEAVFVSHAHADHVRDLPHLIQNRFNQSLPPLKVLALDKVMELLVSHLFNGEIWPDFAKIPVPSTGRPAVEYVPMKSGKVISINGASFTAVQVDHGVPAAGTLVQIDGQTVVFTGDTGPTKAIWKQAEKATGVVAVITEASFPNDHETLAKNSGHLTPETFGVELKKIVHDVPVYASHRKVPFERKIESEIKNLRDRRARVLIEKQYTLGP